MKKKNYYIIFSIVLICITLFVALYSSYTFSSDDNTMIENMEIEDDVSLAGVFVSDIEDTLTEYNQITVQGNNNFQSNYILPHVPVNRKQEGGTCWAISSMNALEATLANKYNLSQYGNSKRINPYHMIYALEGNLGNQNNIYGYRNSTTNAGGSLMDVVLYLTNTTGFTIDSNFHCGTNNNNLNCIFSRTLDQTLNANKEPYTISEIVYSSGITINNQASSNDSNVIKKINDYKTLLSSGVSMTITTTIPNSNQYSSVCYKSSNYSSYCGTKEQADSAPVHQMIIVGWNDNYSKNNFKITPPANGAWIVRNSWSNNYGDPNNNNYFYISYYDYYTLYYESLAITGIVSNNAYDEIYQYNPSGVLVTSNDTHYASGLESVSREIANVYTKRTPNIEQLMSVSFFANKAGVVDIYFKSGNIVDDTLFNSGNKIGTKEVLSKGYYTFDLPISEIKNIDSEQFIIGLKSETGYIFTIQRKSNSNLDNIDVGIKPGISYYKSGTTWKDLNQYSNSPSTAFIKAYTKETNENPSSPSSSEPDLPSNPSPISTTGKVRHLYETVNGGGYNVLYQDSIEGNVGDSAVAQLRNLPGFTPTVSNPITIILDENPENNIVEYKYRRNSYQLAVNAGEGISSTSGNGTYKFGASVTINATISEGYTWKNWTGESTQTSQEYSFTMPDHNVTYTANAERIGSEEILITSLDLNTHNIQLNINDTRQLQAIIDPITATEGVVWRSLDESIVTVDQNGRVTAIGLGKTTITVRNEGQTMGAVCYVTVKDDSIEPISVTGVRLNKNIMTLEIDEEERLTATISPTEASNKEVTWSSSNPNVATIDQNGLVKGKNKGNTLITVTTNDGNKKDTCVVTVNKVNHSFTENPKISITQKTHTMYAGTSYKLDYSVTPTNTEVIWSSSNTNILTVANGEVKAKREGTAIVTLSTKDGSIKDTVTINVKKKDALTSSSTSSSASLSSSSSKPNSQTQITITLDKKELSVIKGQESKLIAKVTGSSKEVVWKSSNENIATVKDGIVTGINEGKTVIIAEVKGTGISTKCNVNIILETEKGIKFSSEEYNVYLEEEKELEIITTPTDMEIENINYEIEDEEIVSIEENKIKGLKLGSTTIRAKVNDEYEAKAIINVIEKPLLIEVSGYNLNFNENTYQYQLKIGKEKELDITSNKDIEVVGNQDLKNKSVITITNLETQQKYTIEIIKRNRLVYYFIGVIVILVLINAIRIIKKKKEE